MEKWRLKLQLIPVVFLSVMVLNLNAQNLLVNPDAETGDTQGWVDVNDAWSAAADITPHGGDYFFWPARLDIAYTEIYQDVDVSSYASQIDAGNLWYDLSGWLANWDQYPHDRATLALEALNGNQEQLLYVSRDHRSPVWTFYELEGQIPAHTRTLRVHLIATRFVGSDNDGYFDDLSLSVNNTAPSVYVTVSAENGLTELPADGTLQLFAATTGGTDGGYNWSSSFEAVATVDTNGLVTAHQAGKFTIQASGKNTGKTGFIELTAYNPEDIVFVTPQTGIQWPAGSVQEVTWHVKGNLSSGTLFFSTTGGSNWMEIASIDSVAGGRFFWTLPDSDKSLNSCYLKMAWDGGESVSSVFSIIPNTTAIKDKAYRNRPGTFQLLTNYPNPFGESHTYQGNANTTIRYQLSATNRVRLTVYNAFGQKVAVLVKGQQAPGRYQVNFNAAGLASGVYFYSLQAGAFKQTRKMIYLR